MQSSKELFVVLQTLGISQSNASKMVSTVMRTFKHLNFLQGALWPSPDDWSVIRDHDLEFALCKAFGIGVTQWRRSLFKYGLSVVLGPVAEPRSIWPIFWAACTGDEPVRQYQQAWMKHSSLMPRIRGATFWKNHCCRTGQWQLFTVLKNTMIALVFTDDPKDVVWDGRWPLRHGATYGIFIKINPSQRNKLTNIYKKHSTFFVSLPPQER